MARKRNVETEGKIAEAATALFCAHGYVDTTMAAIADGAGVSVQTLYLRHGSKAAILSAALDIAIVGDTEKIGVMERDWAPRAIADPDLAWLQLLVREHPREVSLQVFNDLVNHHFLLFFFYNTIISKISQLIT